MTAAETGRLAEALAARVLVSQGCVVLARNHRCAAGELDLVVRDRGCVAFVEVRARRPGALVSPVETVDARKRNKLMAAAYDYLNGHPTLLQPRFDLFLVETMGEDPAAWRWEHLPNAFGDG